MHKGTFGDDILCALEIRLMVFILGRPHIKLQRPDVRNCILSKDFCMFLFSWSNKTAPGILHFAHSASVVKAGLTIGLYQKHIYAGYVH